MSAIVIDTLSGVLAVSWASLFYVLWLEFGAIRHHAAVAARRDDRAPTARPRLSFAKIWLFSPGM